jgi:hypothetical protein
MIGELFRGRDVGKRLGKFSSVRARSGADVVGSREITIGGHDPFVELEAVFAHREVDGMFARFGDIEEDFVRFSAVFLLGPLFAFPSPGVIGHANLIVPFNTTEEILSKYGSRLRHVHLHDNKGGHADLHLPLGAGNVDVRRSIRALQATGFDGTITLEVFTPDRNHFIYSRDLLRKVWQESSVFASAG